jgi:hypothetical protein
LETEELMADRTVYGLTHSENGWRMVDAGSCVWVKVPGTDVHLQIREGQPAKILAAFAADFNANVEPLRDGDSACWTATNSVASSNHLSGTAMDLNWNGSDGRTFRFQIPEERAYPPPKNKAVRELLDFYEGMVFCGGFWSIRDWMHFQMGGNTYGAQNVEKVNDFIRRKIRADGFSTYRRTGTPPPPPPPPPPLSKADQYALAIMDEGRKLGITPRGQKIALSVGLVESNLKNYANRNVPASLALPHDAVGSDHDSVGWAQQRPAWGSLECRMDIRCAARLFFTVDNGPGVRGLTKIRERINGRDGALYDYNDTSRSPGFYAQKVQGSAFPDRYDQRFGEAERLYDRLTAIAPPMQGDDMALVPQEQWDRVYRELTQRHPSRSPLRHLGEGLRDTMAGFLLNTDGNTHVEIVKMLASLGHPESLALLREVADADPVKYPDRQQDRQLAQAILAEATAQPAQARAVQGQPSYQVDNSRELAAAYAELDQLRAENARLKAERAAELVRGATTELATVSDNGAPEKTSGEIAGSVVDSVKDWTARLLTMDAAERGALATALTALQPPTGSK